MEDANQVAALILFTIIGGALGARITKGDYWRGALATAASVCVTGALFAGIGSDSQILGTIAFLFSMMVMCNVLRMKNIECSSTVLGAYAGMLLTGAFYFWTGQGVG